MSSRKRKLSWDGGGFIKRLHQIAEPNLANLAKRAKISDQLVRRYVSGSIPGADIVLAISIAANVSCDWLLTGKDRSESGFGSQWPEEVKKACSHLAAILMSGHEALKQAVMANLAMFTLTLEQDRRIKDLERRMRGKRKGDAGPTQSPSRIPVNPITETEFKEGGIEDEE